MYREAMITAAIIIAGTLAYLGCGAFTAACYARRGPFVDTSESAQITLLWPLMVALELTFRIDGIYAGTIGGMARRPDRQTAAGLQARIAELEHELGIDR